MILSYPAAFPPLACVAGVRKNNPHAVSKRAVELLRNNHIIGLTNLIYGLERESWGTIWRKYRKLLELDSDLLNAFYITPHFWTADGRATRPEQIIQRASPHARA